MREGGMEWRRGWNGGGVGMRGLEWERGWNGEGVGMGGVGMWNGEGWKGGLDWGGAGGWSKKRKRWKLIKQWRRREKEVERLHGVYERLIHRPSE